MSSNVKAIRAERHAEIGALLQQNVGVLVERWRQRALEAQPNARHAHRDVLLDDFPGFLAALGRSLAQSLDSENGPHSQPARAHGAQRWQAGWSLDELVRDYQLLRPVVLEYLDEALDRPLQLNEVLAVGVAFDEAISESVGHYVRHRDEQLEELHRSIKEQSTALKEADRRKNEFLATLAHELRNPLAPLRNSLDILRLAPPGTAPVADVCGIMDRQIHVLTRLLDDLLDVSRIAQGKLVLRQERLDLRTILDDALQMSRPSLETRRHRVSLALPAEPLPGLVDRARLLQVFVNLLNNAAKYTPEGGHIELGAERCDGQVVVTVKDNGIGIPGDMLGRVFDLFTQLDGRRGDGLGIGLTLVRRLVELHGGRVRVHSAGEGQGSEFTVTLPAANGAAQPAHELAAQPPPGPGRRILIVEDNIDGRESLATLLRMLGHEVSVAGDGPSGLQAALADKPAVALIDIGLPGLDGYEVARQVRAGLGAAVLLVALTGHSQPEDRRRALEAGFNAHLPKPIDLDALRQLLQ